MDEERSAPAISPKPPEDGDPCPAAPLPILHVKATIEIENKALIPTTSRGQPAARSTPIHPTQPCRTQPSSQIRNGIKHHAHTHSPHCPRPTPHTHSLQSGGDRNGGPHPKLGSLPRGGSSTSSSSSAGPRNSKKLQSNPSITSQSSKRSKASSRSSSKSNSSQIPTEAQDDCCVHCILACLFCEFLTLCNIVLDCATCGSCAGNDSCFCCCCASEECGDCDLPCDMDCGIIDACCESADCLEICMECCSLCFSS
ncbi:myoD family inhibitor isoform X2 [Phyllopteryx taeniolatus]|uniref:myoD family inhibitor isoform X2 n=1 Tax=Phyllopteryx taeniolatus TaxID=161469 RepID=UPI002AD2A4FB|nr:myoD family inhibitor isoform X2 [Phyllopteryx taeniolatus]